MRGKKGFEALETIREQAAEFSKLLQEKEAAHQKERQRREDDHALFAEEMKRIGVTGRDSHENDHDLFAKEMQRLGVTALKGQKNQVTHSTVKPKRAVVEQTPAKLFAEVGLSDNYDGASADDWGDREYIAVGCGIDLARNLARGLWPVKAQLDLHGLRTEEARRTLVDFILEAHEHGIRCVRIVHGKGINSGEDGPVLKGLVRRWLRQMREVLAFTQAPTEEGGSGALRVLLAKKVG